MRKSAVFMILALALFPYALWAEQKISEEEQYLYRELPDIEVRTTDGGNVPLSRIYRDKPVLLTLTYTRCPGICYPYVMSLRAGLSKIGGLGASYRVVVLSFDPRDRLADMKAMAQGLGLAEDRNWIFGAASQKDIQRLLETVGFSFVWDPEKGEYDHPALLVGVDSEGRIIRRLAGFTEMSMLAGAVRELKGEFFPFYPLQKGAVLFRCFDYDPESGEWGFSWGILLVVLPAALAFGIVLSLSLFARRDRRLRGL